MAFLLWDIGKQHSPRCDAAASHLRLSCLNREISSKNESKNKKITPNTPKNESGLTQLIMLGESIHQIWVKVSRPDKLFHQTEAANKNNGKPFEPFYCIYCISQRNVTCTKGGPVNRGLCLPCKKLFNAQASNLQIYYLHMFWVCIQNFRKIHLRIKSQYTIQNYKSCRPGAR